MRYENNIIFGIFMLLSTKLKQICGTKTGLFQLSFSRYFLDMGEISLFYAVRCYKLIFLVKR